MAENETNQFKWVDWNEEKEKKRTAWVHKILEMDLNEGLVEIVNELSYIKFGTTVPPGNY